MIALLWLLLYVFLAAIVVMAILCGILRATRSKTVIENITPDLQNVFDQGTATNNMSVETGIKPFSVVSSSRRQLVKDAFRFGLDTNTLSPILFGQSQLVGFRFHVITPLNITAMQFIPQLSPFPDIPRSVAVYDLTTMLEITTPNDRTIDKKTDQVQNGFVAHFLTTPIPLEPFRSYAIVGLVASGEQAISHVAVAYSADLVMEGSAGTPNTNVLAAPTVLGNVGDIRHFFGFQTQLRDVLHQSVFDVDLVNGGGFGRFPPGYVRGLNISTNTSSNIVIEKGVALSQQGVSNIVLPVSISLAAKSGINGLDTGVFQTDFWYHVYVIASSKIGLPTAGLVSLNAQEPSVLPLGYDVFRRLGAVRWLGGTAGFDSMQQDGDGATRSTFYSNNTHGFLAVVGSTNTNYVSSTLKFVPPGAFQCLIGVTGTMVGLTQNSSSTPVNALVRFRPRFNTTEGVWNVSFQNAKNMSDEITIVLGDSPVPHELEVRVFAENPNGFIPNDANNTNIGQFVSSYRILSYTETI